MTPQVGSEDRGRESIGLRREEEWVLLQHSPPERGAVLGDGGACECGERWMGLLGKQRRKSLGVALLVSDMCDEYMRDQVCICAGVV